MPGLLLDTLRGVQTGKRPIWLMRQAGRYLPEYRALRASKGGFLALAITPFEVNSLGDISISSARGFRYNRGTACLLT